MWALLFALRSSAKLSKLDFGYGKLEPEFDPEVSVYTLYVPRCSEEGFENKFQLSDLKCSAEAGYDTQITFEAGNFRMASSHDCAGTLSDDSGLTNSQFKGITLHINTRDDKQPTHYEVHILPSTEISKVHCRAVGSTPAAPAPGPDPVPTDPIPMAPDTAIPRPICEVEHAELRGETCLCKKGFVGNLQLQENTYVGKCEPAHHGEWPCTGEVPFVCGKCPSCDDADAIIIDLETSCSIPLSIDVNNIISHTQHSNLAEINPDIRRNICISPICRWRVELAHNAFALCQTLAGKNIGSMVHWRGQQHSFHTIKRIIHTLHRAKDDCHIVRSAQNICSSTMLHMKLLVTGIDVRSDATMREGEIAYRSAFSKVLNWPKRRIDVRVEPQLCSLDPVCDHNHCGYGACVPHWTKIHQSQSSSGDNSGGWFSSISGIFGGDEDETAELDSNSGAAYGYRCACNECFKECIIDGVRTCKREENCKATDHCEPNPCECGGVCTGCPECEARGEAPYTCKCPSFFGGVTCDTFTCPSGYSEKTNSHYQERCERACVPVMGANPCDPNPCEHGGICQKGALEGSFKCDCPTTWTGESCEKLNCGPDFVEESGICISKRTQFKKRAGNCKDPCKQDPCQNGGFCIPMTSTCMFQCQCIQGWLGETCELRTDPCSPDPCPPGQLCHASSKSLDGYTCECDEWCQHHPGEISQRVREQLARRQLKGRKLEEAPPDIQFDWESGNAISAVRPVPATEDIPEHNTCAVWQHDRQRRAEVVVSVKCPIDDMEKCSDMAMELERMHQNHNFRKLEHIARFGCIPTHVNASSEVTEEYLQSNCPHQSQIDQKWHQLYVGCHFDECDLGPTDEIQVIISATGSESVDQRFKENACSIPMCRALIMNFHALFKNCRNSAPGYMGKLARKAKALYNFVHSCSNPDGIAVIRQQIKIIGVLDELSHTELRNAEEVLKDIIVKKLGLSDVDRLSVKARPALKSQNTINARFIEPQGEFKPTFLPVDATLPMDPECTGLCVMSAQPGPQKEFTMDPASHIYVTFNEPILPGDCWSTGGSNCRVVLKVQGGGTTTEFDQLEDEMYSLDRIDSTIFIAGETMFLKPWFTLKPYSNYSVTIYPEVLQAVDRRIPGLGAPFEYWFLSGPPAGSVVFMSVALGCDDVGVCEGWNKRLHDFASDTYTHAIEPIKKSTDDLRQQQLRDTGFRATSRRLFDKDEDTPIPGVLESNFMDDLVAAEIRVQKRRLAEDIDPTSGGIAGPRGNAGNPTVDLRSEGLNHCVPERSWLFWNLLSFVVFVLTILAVYCAGRAVSWWVQDAFSNHTGYFKSDIPNPKQQDMVLTYWKSVVTENSSSCSRIMRGPAVWWPLVSMITICCLWLVGYIWCKSGDGGWEDGMICGATASTISCIVFCLMAVVAAVWANPGNIPFYPFKHRYKLSKEPWLETSWRDAPRAGQPGPRPGPGLTQKDSSLDGKPLAPPDACAHGGPHESRNSAMQDMMLKGVEYHESEKEITFTIPKPVAASRFQPDRLNDPYRKASIAAAWAALLAFLGILLALIMIPMNAIHVCPDKFYYIWFVAFISLIVSIIVRFLCYCLTKRHCQFWDAGKTAQAHDYLQLGTDESRHGQHGSYQSRGNEQGAYQSGYQGGNQGNQSSAYQSQGGYNQGSGTRY